MRPYIDIEITDEYIIREFNENIDPIELMWHRDDEGNQIKDPSKWCSNWFHPKEKDETV